jgi:hypothetical protein
MKTLTQAPTVKPLRLHDNGVDVTAEHVGTTIVLVGARPQHPSLKAKVTKARSGPRHQRKDDR